MDYIIPITSFIILSIVTIVASIIASSEESEPNHVIGIRTKETLRSKEAWNLAHKKFFMYGISSGIVSASFAVIILAFLMVDGFQNLITPFSFVGHLLVLLILVYGAVISNTEAKKLNNTLGK